LITLLGEAASLMVKAGSRTTLDRIDDDFLAHVGHRVFEHENELRLGAIAG
jgi:hypothetical protein